MSTQLPPLSGKTFQAARFGATVEKPRQTRRREKPVQDAPAPYVSTTVPRGRNYKHPLPVDPKPDKRKPLNGPVHLVSTLINKAFRAHMGGTIPLVVEHEPLALPGLGKAWHGKKIAQVSDLHHYQHTDGHYDDYLEEVVNKVNREKPDIVLFTGDLIHYGKQFLDPAKRKFLDKLYDAPLGKFAVLGNHDYYDNEEGQAVIATLERAGFKVLVNDSVRLTLDGQPLNISGVDDWHFGEQNDAQAFAKVRPGEPHLCMAHNPEHADDIAVFDKREAAKHTGLAYNPAERELLALKAPANNPVETLLSKSVSTPQVILSGDTHGEMFKGPRLTKALHAIKRVYRYPAGWYKVDNTSGRDVTVRTNRGITPAFVTKRTKLFNAAMPPLRVGTTSEVTIFKLTDQWPEDQTFQTPNPKPSKVKKSKGEKIKALLQALKG